MLTNKRVISEDLRNLRRAAFLEEIERAKRVLVKCTEIENNYIRTSQDTIDNERKLSNIYDDSKQQANIKERKRQEDSNIGLLAYKNYLASVEEKLHPSTRKAMLKRIEAEEKNERLLQDAHRTRWEALDHIECKRRESVKCFYLHAQEQYMTTINNIINTEAHAKLAFVNYNTMLENVEI